MKKSGSFSLVLTLLVGFSGTFPKLETEVVTEQEEKKAQGCLDMWLARAVNETSQYQVRVFSLS